MGGNAGKEIQAMQRTVLGLTKELNNARSSLMQTKGRLQEAARFEVCARCGRCHRCPWVSAGGLAAGGAPGQLHG